MQKTTGILFKNRRFWFVAGLFAVALTAAGIFSFINLRPAVAAGNIDWLNYGVLEFENKTYVLQKREFGANKGAGYAFSSPFDDHMGYGEQDSGVMSSGGGQSVVYAPVGTPTCIDKGNKEYFHEYLRFNVTGTDVNANFSKGSYFKVNENDKDSSGNLNCTFPAGVSANSNNAANRRIWFFKEGDKVYSFDRAVSFSKTGTGPGGVDLYTRDGDPVAAVNGVTCKDLLVGTGNSWLIYPMGPQPDVATSFSPGRNAVSESYDAYLSSGGRASANCRVNSLELRSIFMSGVITHTGVLGKDKNVPCPGNIPGSVNFDGEEGKKDYYVVACRTGTGDRKIIDYVVMNGNIVRFHEADFVPSGGDDGYKLVRGVSNRVPKATPAVGAGIVGTPGSTGTSGSADTRPICAIGDYMGWLLCGAAQLADSIVSVVQDIIVSLLVINPLNLSGTDSVYKIWDTLRNVGNIAFVFVFMVIIFSQATSIGITNYGIKRLLPKLVVAGVLANTSYFVYAAGVDASNIGTLGLRILIEGIMGDAGINISGLEVPAGTGAPEKILLTGLGGGIFTFLIKAKGIEAIIIPMLIGVLIIVVAVLALILRQVLILAIGAASAIVVVMFILPGTAPTGRKILNLAGKLLLMGPMIVLVFAGGHLVAAFIVATVPADANTLTRTFLIGVALTSKWAVLGFIPAMFTASGFAMSWLYKTGAGFAQKANQGIRGSRGVRLREESREAAKNKAYLDRLTGARGGPRATVERLTRRATMSTLMGGSADARRELEERLYSQRQKLDAEKADALQRRLTRNSAIALASEGTISGNTFTFAKEFTTDSKGNRVQKTLDLNAADLEAVKYAQQTGGQESTAGVKATGAFLHSMGDMNASRLETLVNRGKNSAERAELNNTLNSLAAKEGEWQWAYNSVAEDPATNKAAVQIGGQKGADPTTALVNIIKSKGVGNMSKELYSADEFDQNVVRDAMSQIFQANQDAFIKQTLNINEDKKLDGIAMSIGLARRARDPSDPNKTIIDRSAFEQMRKSVGQQYR